MKRLQVFKAKQQRRNSLELCKSSKVFPTFELQHHSPRASNSGSSYRLASSSSKEHRSSLFSHSALECIYCCFSSRPVKNHHCDVIKTVGQGYFQALLIHIKLNIFNEFYHIFIFCIGFLRMATFDQRVCNFNGKFPHA